MLAGATFAAASLFATTLSQPFGLWFMVALTHAASLFILRAASLAGWPITWRVMTSVWVFMTVRGTVNVALELGGHNDGRVAELNVISGVVAAGLGWLAVREFASPHLAHPSTRRPVLAVGASLLVFFIAGGFLDTRLTTGHFEPGLKVLVAAYAVLWLVAAWHCTRVARHLLQRDRVAEALVLIGILGASVSSLGFGLGAHLGISLLALQPIPIFVPVAVAVPFVAAAVVHPSASMIGRPEPGFAAQRYRAAHLELAPFGVVAVSLLAIFIGAPTYTLALAAVLIGLLVGTTAMNLGIGPLASWWPWQNQTLVARDVIGALVNRELGVVLEPLVRVHDDQQVGTRVRLSWRHPRYGHIDHETIRRTAAATGLTSVLDTTTALWAVEHLAELLANIDADEPTLVIPLSRGCLRSGNVVDVLLTGVGSASEPALDGLVVELDEAPWLEDTASLFALQNSGVSCMCPLPSRGAMRLQDPDFVAIDLHELRRLSPLAISTLSSAARLVITNVASPADLAGIPIPYTALYTLSPVLSALPSPTTPPSLPSPTGGSGRR